MTAPRTGMPAAPPGPERVPRWAPLRHVALAGGLGVLTAVAGFPLLVMVTFSGSTVAALVVVAVATVVASAVAVALDRAVGPGRYRPTWDDGSAGRGVALGVVGTLGILGLGLLALAVDLDDRLADEALYALMALPFVVVAALQWPGLPRVVGLLVLAGGVGLAVVQVDQPDAPSTLAERMAAAGYAERPWVADVAGSHPYAVAVGQLGGMSTTYTSDDLPPGRWVMITALPAEAVPGGDPCAAPTLPGTSGVMTVATCAPGADGVWLRTGAPDLPMNVPGGTDVVQERNGRWIAVTADPDVPVDLLRTALAGAAPMTDEQLDEWLGLIGFPG